MKKVIEFSPVLFFDVSLDIIYAFRERVKMSNNFAIARTRKDEGWITYSQHQEVPHQGTKGETWSTLSYDQEMDHTENSFLQERATLAMQEVYYGTSSNKPGNYGTTRGHLELKTQ